MRFIKFPWSIYKKDKYWVPPLIFDVRNNLNPLKNPFFQHSEINLYLAEKDGKIAGRIAAIKNDNYNNFHKDKTGFFGFFDSIDDQDVADQLFETACIWCKEKGFDKISGPVNPSTNDECGILIDGFESSPVILMPYNYKYYQRIIEEFGFEKEIDMYAYYCPAEVINNLQSMAQFERMASFVKKRYDVKLRNLNMKELNNEVRRIENIYNDAWELNWGFVPMTSAEFDYMANMLKIMVDPDFVMFAEIGNKPVGFSLTMPDVNQVLKKLNGRLFPFGFLKFLMAKKKINMLRVIVMGVKQEYQKKGIDSLFYLETIKMGNKKNYKAGEISWVLENNHVMRQTAEKIGAYIYKTYRIYSKTLN